MVVRVADPIAFFESWLASDSDLKDASPASRLLRVSGK
jgi:hypothetical protein